MQMKKSFEEIEAIVNKHTNGTSGWRVTIRQKGIPDVCGDSSLGNLAGYIFNLQRGYPKAEFLVEGIYSWNKDIMCWI